MRLLGFVLTPIQGRHQTHPVDELRRNEGVENEHILHKDPATAALVHPSNLNFSTCTYAFWHSAEQ